VISYYKCANNIWHSQAITIHASALDSARSLFVSIPRLEMVFFRSIHGLPELNAEACIFMSLYAAAKLEGLSIKRKMNTFAL